MLLPVGTFLPIEEAQKNIWFRTKGKAYSDDDMV